MTELEKAYDKWRETVNAPNAREVWQACYATILEAMRGRAFFSVVSKGGAGLIELSDLEAFGKEGGV